MTILKIFGAIASLFCFVAGVLWFEGKFIFADAIASIFGLKALTPESLKMGWTMLIVVGYVVFYTVDVSSKYWSYE